LRILSGIQPSGKIHIGNYFGMIKNMIELQNDGEIFAFLVSYHALTSVKNKEALEQNSYEAAINFLALGLDPEKSTFWIQHDVKEVLELYWILSNHTPMGLLERAHSYKDKTAKGIQANHGLFSYPVLMAADILLFDANIVPVGKDQIQHVEMTRDIAISFNHAYNKEVFILPRAKVDDNVATVIGTNGAKMSKSYNNTIDMFTSPKERKKQVMSIITDSKELDEPKTWENCNIYAISKLFMNEDELANLRQSYATPGVGYGHLKQTLLKKIDEYFKPYEEKREYYLNNKKEVREILQFGACKARKIASEKIKEIREIIGLI